MISIVYVTTFLLLFSGIQVQTSVSNIKSLLPLAEEIPDWSPEDESQIVVGDDLYLLINGGAEIYQEYGFNQALYQTFADTQDNRINLEIYEMKDPVAAYGMYTFKTKTTGDQLDVGADGWMSSYYLNFWKGPYVVTLIGLDEKENISDELTRIARIQEAKIQAASIRPHIISYLPERDLLPNGLTYIRGNLALVNQYPFATQNIFNCTEGVHGDYPGYSIFIFEYMDSDEAQTWFQFSKDFIRKSERYSGFMEMNDSYAVRDQKENKLIFEMHRRWIIIFIGSPEKDTQKLFKILRAKLTP